MRFWSPLCALPLLLIACGDKSAISLSVDIPMAAVQVMDSPFAGSSTLSGTFQLLLTVGPEASGSTQVSLGNFSLQDQSGASLADNLSLDPDAAFPLEVDKGASKTVTFKFSAESVDHAKVCAGAVRIVGSVMDSLKGATDPVGSGPITPNCPPTT